jgi:PBSX family phage terminase large subunit
MRRRHLWPDTNKQRTIEQTAKILREREEAEAQEQTISAKPTAPRFRGDNLAIQSYQGREWILAGPSETGKTWTTLWLLDSLLRSTSGAKATLLRKVQADLSSTVLVTWDAIQDLREAMGHERARAFGGINAQLYIYPNGSRLWCGGLDKPKKVLSGERDFIYINQAEELTLEDWEICHTRTTGRGGVTSHPMTFGDCNPGPGDHWILKRETLKLFHSKHEDNPSLFTDAGVITPQGVRTMQTLDSLTGIRYKRLRKGLWVGAEGLFFEEFDPEDSRFVIEPLKTIPADWPIWGALDYGFKHPTAFGLFTQDNDGTIYLIGEHSQHQWPVSHHCKAIRRLLAKLGIEARRMRKVVAGHDVFQERGAADGKTIADQYRDAVNPEADELLLNGEVVKMPQGMPIGFKLEMANVARITGAQELLMRFGNREMNIAPSLLLYNTCPRTAATIARMVTDPREAEDVKKVDADLNGDGGDDQYDCLRYGTMAAWVTRKGVMTISRHRV